jgi:hypothetical protein
LRTVTAWTLKLDGDQHARRQIVQMARAAGVLGPGSSDPEGAGGDTAKAFREIARFTKGTYFRFDEVAARDAICEIRPTTAPTRSGASANERPVAALRIADCDVDAAARHGVRHSAQSVPWAWSLRLGTSLLWTFPGGVGGQRVGAQNKSEPVTVQVRTEILGQIA